MIFLRDLKSSDVSELLKVANHPDIGKRMISLAYPFTESDAKALINNSGSNNLTYGIEEIESGSLIGTISLRDYDPVHEQIEMSMWINPNWWGIGYSIDASMQMLNHAFSKFNTNRVYAHCTTDNKKSISLLRRIGFTKEGLLRERVKLEDGYMDVFLFSLLKKEWLSE